MRVLLGLAFFIALCGCVAARNEPILEWHFTLNCTDLSGGTTQHFTDSFFTHVEGISNQNEWECERYTTNTGRETTSCLPSQLVVKPLVFKRILTTNDDFWDWRDLVANGQLSLARRECSIQMFTRDYVKTFNWVARNAWPASIEIEPLGTMIPGEAPGKKALMEVITVIHEGLARTGHTAETQALGHIITDV